MLSCNSSIHAPLFSLFVLRCISFGSIFSFGPHLLILFFFVCSALLSFDSVSHLLFTWLCPPGLGVIMSIEVNDFTKCSETTAKLVQVDKKHPIWQLIFSPESVLPLSVPVLFESLSLLPPFWISQPFLYPSDPFSLTSSFTFV